MNKKTKIDISSWNRKEHYTFFGSFEDPFFGITSKADITKSYNEAKRDGASIFLYSLHSILRALNSIEELRLRIENEDVFLYDKIGAIICDSFEDILLKRFNPFYGKNYYEIAANLKMTPSIAKHKYAMLVSRILLNGKGSITNSEEFQKAGIIFKTIRVNCNGTINESMSFENIDYNEVYEQDDWYESRLYELFTSRFLFVVFKELDCYIEGLNRREKMFVLDKAFFWTMSESDLVEAKTYWENIRNNVINDTIEHKYFYKIADHRKFHVRPKALLSTDMVMNPQGTHLVKKYAYWFNSEYIRDIVKNAYGSDWASKYENK